MDLISKLTMRGGVVDHRTLVELSGGAAQATQAVRTGVVERVARGRFALPETSAGVKTAYSVAGVLSYRSAAHFWGWAQKKPDGLPEVTFDRNRAVERELRKILIPHWSDLPDDDVVKGTVTTQRRTLIDCLRMLPFDEALAIADSALRAGDVTKDELLAIAHSTRGRGRTRIIGVAEAATAKSANEFESVFRAQCLLVPGLAPVAQEPTEFDELVLHPDVADVELRLALETEGFEWHHKPAQLTKDCRRYNLFILDGWLLLRFTWRMVMYEAAYVHEVLLRARGAACGPGRQRHANVALAA